MDRLHQLETQCPNREAFKMFVSDKGIFAKLAGQCAHLSATDAIVFEPAPQTNNFSPKLYNGNTEPESELSHLVACNPIRFSPMSDAMLDQIKQQVLLEGA